MLVEHPFHAACCQLNYGCDQSRQKEESLGVVILEACCGGVRLKFFC